MMTDRTKGEGMMALSALHRERCPLREATPDACGCAIGIVYRMLSQVNKAAGWNSVPGETDAGLRIAEAPQPDQDPDQDAPEPDLYSVIVGNVGTVYAGDDETEARKSFAAYLHYSRTNYGRAADEPVTLWKNGEPIKEHAPAAQDETLTLEDLINTPATPTATVLCFNDDFWVVDFEGRRYPFGAAEHLARAAAARWQSGQDSTARYQSNAPDWEPVPVEDQHAATSNAVTCSACGEVKPVCCDDYIGPDGPVNPRCKACCDHTTQWQPTPQHERGE